MPGIIAFLSSYVLVGLSAAEKNGYEMERFAFLQYKGSAESSFQQQ